MKLLLAIALLSTAACATAPRMNCDESCALQGMVCTGQSMTEGSGSSFNVQSLASSNQNYSGMTYQCAKDASKSAEILAMQEKIRARQQAEQARPPVSKHSSITH